MFSMEGVFDLHVHSAPDTFDRSGDDLSFSYAGEKLGMAGIGVKSALGCTASRAYLINKVVNGKFRLVGGVTLNYPVGGINPAAVDACFRLGGRIVWAPSGHSQFHAKRKGSLGKWGPRGMALYNPADAQGITVLDERGELIAEIKEVLALVKENNGVFCTSHLAPEESIALAKYCGKEKIKIVFTHLGWAPEYSFEVGKEFSDLGGMIELTSVTFGSFDNTLNKEVAVKMIKEYGYDKVILASDAGNSRFAVPCETLRAFAENLILLGIPEHAVRRMASDNPLSMVAM